MKIHCTIYIEWTGLWKIVACNILYCYICHYNFIYCMQTYRALIAVNVTVVKITHLLGTTLIKNSRI